MKTKTCALLVAVILLAGVCLAASKPVTDGYISDQVMLKLAGDRDVKGSGLKVDVKDGVVTLSGVVEQDSQRDKAAKLAKKIKGVKQVINHIETKRHG